MRRAIDDAFADFDLVALPTPRRTPRTIDASIKREESEKPRNPELENTGQFNVYGIPVISVTLRVHVERAAGGAHDRRTAIFGGKGAGASPRLRAGNGMARAKAGTESGHEGAAAGGKGN